jgi:hypothetical protein
VGLTQHCINGIGHRRSKTNPRKDRKIWNVIAHVAASLG